MERTLLVCLVCFSLAPCLLAESTVCSSRISVYKVEDRKIAFKLSPKDTKVKIATSGTGSIQSDVAVLKKNNTLQVAEIKSLERTKGKSSFTVLYANDISVCYEVNLNTGYVGIKPSEPVEIKISLKAPAIVIPDDLTYDTVFQASKYKGNINLPTDGQYLLGLSKGCNSIVAILWPAGLEKVTAQSNQGNFSEVSLSVDAGKQIYVGLLTGKNIWHCCTKELSDMKAVAASWKRPFNARWIAAMCVKKQALIEKGSRWDSWNIGDHEQGPKSVGRYGIQIWKKPDKFRAWNAGFSGFYQYPALWKNNKLWLKHAKFRFRKVIYDQNAPVFIYPLYNIKNTKADILLPRSAIEKFYGPTVIADLIRSSHKKHLYLPTCGMTAKIERIFYKSQQKQQKNKIQEMVHLLDMYVVTTYQRIQEYISFSNTMEQWLVRECKKDPQIRADIEPFITSLREIPKYYAKHKDVIKTPAYEAGLSKQFVSLIDEDVDEEQQEERSKLIGRQIRRIGGALDDVLGNTATHMRCLRQMAGMQMAKARQPQSARVLQEFRLKTHRMLNKIFGMEGR